MIGLDYCHQRGVVNRDVKLNNMLVQVRFIVVGIYGLHMV
jgi:hypothetical protein